jgi:mRNA interferase MazF
MNRQIKRGDIYNASLDPVIGCEQGDHRPVLIVQNDIGNEHSPTVVVAPITASQSKKKLPTHVILSTACGLDKESVMLAEQIRAIDRSRLGNYIGRVNRSDQLKIDRALAICFGLRLDENHDPDKLVRTLCFRCERDYRDGGMKLTKSNWQLEYGFCDICRSYKALKFDVFPE